MRRLEIEALKSAATKIISDDTAGQGPTLVYHYTSLDVAVKILDSFEMWCTNVAFSNDTSEGKHGESVIGNVCASDQDLFLRGARELIADEIDGYAACFSVDPDELTQWREYGQKGAGVSIGVDVDVLSKRARVAFSGVEYDEARQRTLVRHLLNLFRTRMVSAKSRPRRLRQLAYLLTLSFVMLRAKLKHPSYHSEREYRLFDALPKDAKQHNTQLEYFPRGTRQVPFFRVDLRASEGAEASQPVREVWVGTCADFAIAQSAIRNTVAYRTSTFPIRRSQVPMCCD